MTAMRGDTTAAERFEERMVRLSARQRVVVLTFETVERALEWDQLDDTTALAALATVLP